MPPNSCTLCPHERTHCPDTLWLLHPDRCVTGACARNRPRHYELHHCGNPLGPTEAGRCRAALPGGRSTDQCGRLHKHVGSFDRCHRRRGRRSWAKVPSGCSRAAWRAARSSRQSLPSARTTSARNAPTTRRPRGFGSRSNNDAARQVNGGLGERRRAEHVRQGFLLRGDERFQPIEQAIEMEDVRCRPPRFALEVALQFQVAEV